MEIDSRGRKRIVRTVYRRACFRALRDRLRCKEIWVVGAHEWRNPDPSANWKRAFRPHSMRSGFGSRLRS